MTSVSSQLVRIQICGALAVERDGERLDGRLPGRQGRLLFTYLVVNRHRHVLRDEVAEALWREPDPAAVDARLNPLLSKLRRVFGADAVDGRSTLRPPSGCACAMPGSTWRQPPRLSTGPNPQWLSRTGRGRGGRR